MPKRSKARRVSLLAVGMVLAGGRLLALAEPPSMASQTIPGPAIPAQLEALSPEVSPRFRQQASHASESIPPQIWSGLRQAGWQVYLAEFVVDAAPALRGVQPRGWPSGWTWDNTDALHLPDQRLLVIAEKRRDRAGKVVATTRLDGVLRHELGHAFDMACGSPYRFRSEDPEFLANYQSDLQSMPTDSAARLDYFRQVAQAGRQEAFAEAFAVVLGGGSAIEDQEAFQTAFPSVIQYLRRVIGEYQPP